MITFQETYTSRKEEIENFFGIHEIFRRKENEREDGRSKFFGIFFIQRMGEFN